MIGEIAGRTLNPGTLKRLQTASGSLFVDRTATGRGGNVMTGLM